MNQRWLARLSSFRSDAERIRPAEYDVVVIDQDRTARAFVEAHHYSGSYPAARERLGLYRRGALAGVAVFSHPCNNHTLTNVFPGQPALSSVELGRFVLLDEVPGNGETWFLARCFEQLRLAGYRGVLSFSDPIARTTATGLTVFPGHLGTIYQAHNARYLGRGRADTLRLLPDGTVLARRTYQKIRAGEKGWRAGAALLERHGADPIELEADEPARRAWLDRWMARLTRPLRHPGNHRYAWALSRSVRLPESASYPKRLAA